MAIIPVNEPLIGDKEIEYVNEALSTGWISSEGKFITAFETNFANYVSRSHGIAVNNGTNALVLALRALELPKGSEVVIPSFTIISCALACIYNDLVPVFVDSEEETWNIDTSKIEEKITSNTKAIMPVHIYGHPVNMGEILRIANKHKLFVIEDFAEAIGSEFKGTKCGKFGDISCVSFYANKVITTGEGGMCLTDDNVLAERLRKLRNLAFEPKKRFIHYELGFNFRMTNVQAAIGLAQIERVEELVKKKVDIGEKYTERLKELQNKGFIQLPCQKEWAKNTYWMYGIVLKEKSGLTSEAAMAKLADAGIQTRPFFYPMHMQPVFEKYNWKKETLPVSERIYTYGFYLPSGLSLTDDQISLVAENIKRVIQ